MLSWGVGQVVVKRATDRLGAVTMVLFVSLVDGIVYLALFALLAPPITAPASVLVYAALAAVTGMLGYILYFEALLRGSVAVVATIVAGAPIITVAGAVLFLGETPSAWQLAGVAILLVVILAVSYEPVGSQWRVRAAVSLSLAILVLWGVWAVLVKAAYDSGTFVPSQILLFYSLSNFGMGLPYVAFRRRAAPQPAPSRRNATLAGAGFLLLILGILASTFALSIGDASLVTVVANCAPVVTSIIAFVFLKEKATAMRIAALLLFIPGIVLVAL